jgi:beta-carotene hydroxylase
MVAWGLGNVLFWLALWPLTLTGTLPLWAGFLLATISISLCYLPSHEAQHSIIAAEGTRLRWLNELVGYVSILPLVLPYRIARLTHHEHHAHANDPLRDPDHYNQADTWWESIWRGVQSRQPGAENPYSSFLTDSEDPEVRRALLEGLCLRSGHYIVLAVLAWSGFAIEAALLWWLPRHIATSYIQLVLSWAPHHPMVEQGRYRNTRAWRSPLGTLLSLGMEYHLIHHLFPKIPLTQTPAAWRAMRDLLETRGIRNDGLG